MNIIQRLPMDIILRIIPYTYNVQNKELLNDIIHFNTTRVFLMELYFSYWIKYSYLIHEDDLCWLVNDMLGYMNNHYAIGHVFTPKLLGIYYRNPFLKTREDVVKYMGCLYKKNIKSQFNLCLGLFNPQEREEFKSIALRHLSQDV